MTRDSASRRAERARLLEARHPEASAMLGFYAGVAGYQSALLDRAAADAADDAQVLASIPAFLDWMTRSAPSSLAGEARGLRDLEEASWRRWLDSAFADGSAPSPGRDAAALFVVEALVQACAERAAPPAAPADGVAAGIAAGDRPVARCPACGRAPVVGVLREEGHGARRSLVCVRCHAEWSIERVMCVACGEREFEKLPVFTAEQFPHIRIEACERCRAYLKTVDLTRDGLAIPVVDDLASPSLDLWARAQGYVRIRPNLLRT